MASVASLLSQAPTSLSPRVRPCAMPVTRVFPNISVCSRGRGPLASTSAPAAKRRAPRRRTLAPPCAALPEGLAETFAGSPLLQDATAATFGAVGGAVWVKLFKVLASKGILEQKLSRKLVHTTSGPLLAITWLLYSSDPSARFWACIAPAINATRLAAVGSGMLKDEALVRSVSREDDPSELLGGPFYYCLVLIAATAVFWRTSPVGLLMLALMCGGDGLADIVGRRYGTAKLPVNPNKSWAGSVAMLTTGTLMGVGFLQLFSAFGYIDSDTASFYPAIIVIALFATIIECLPVSDEIDDNLSVPAATAVAALVAFSGTGIQSAL